MTTEKQARRKYSEEFKREAVALVTDQGYKLLFSKFLRALYLRGDRLANLSHGSPFRSGWR
jgi:hypothetical protein